LDALPWSFGSIYLTGATHRPEGFWKDLPELQQPSGRFA
jgi:hypothetical protein